MNIYIRLFAILNLANGIFMLVAPETWYETVPGVKDTGPYNSHFVRDIGIAFVASSVGIWISLGDSWHNRFSAAAVGLMFLAGHALFHLILIFIHQPGAAAILRDLALIVVPSAIAMLWLVLQLGRQMQTTNS